MAKATEIDIEARAKAGRENFRLLQIFTLPTTSTRSCACRLRLVVAWGACA